ncbi:mechanosensitive ion channel family protein [Pseudohalioglobus sediminis]|nr:mechanosensitive ion channel family protein [Pseudohalioglobus sediminis]
MPDPNQVTEPAPVAEPSVEQAIAEVMPINEDTLFILQLFDQMDATAPLLRLTIAAVIIGVSLLLLLLTRFYVKRRLKRMEETPEERYKALRLQAQDLLSSADMKNLWMGVWTWVGRLLSLLFILSAINGLLLTSGWTLRLAAGMINAFVDAVVYIWHGFVQYLPNLVTIIVIIIVARFMIRTLGLIFDGIRTRRIYLKNFYPEWADTSFGIIKLLVYALTAVIIFPYLPGSSSPAFQGISIFVGVLVSLGSTTAVANVIAGIVLTYTRAFSVGDQVEVADTRGRVVERSTFVTRIQTLKNVIVSIPNSMVLTNNIINYSKNMGQRGLLVHTSVTIGYDVPWQTVNALLIAAAIKTEHIAETPEPFVLQTSLDDNYVSYEINGWTRTPEELPRIYSNLHANILDEFHGHQVEITSPHYRAVRDGNASTVADVLPREAPDTEEKPA